MGYILNLPPNSPADASLSVFYQRLSLEYATLRTNVRESLSEAMVISLCNRLAQTFQCAKKGFRKANGNTSMEFEGRNGGRMTVVISPDGYGAGTNTRKACPSCGQAYDGRAKLGGLGWTNAHNIINHGKIGPAVQQAIDDTLKTGTVSDPRLASTQAPIKDLIALLRGKAEGYGGPAATSTAGEQCPICEKIHASDSLLQRHERSKLHVQAGHTYRSIKIDGNDYIRGNECIVGMQFGATRTKPEGDLARLKAYTHSMAGNIAEEVLATLDKVYVDGDPRYDRVLAMDLLLKSDTLTWALRKRLIDAATGPLPLLPADRAQVNLVSPVLPPATTVPVIPAPQLTAANVAPPPVPPQPQPDTVVAPASSGIIPDAPPLPPDSAVQTTPGSRWPMYIGSLKQRLLRAPYADAGVSRIQRARQFRGDLVPGLADYGEPREKLHYMLDQFWQAFKQRKMSEPDFQALVREFALIGFDKVRGSKVAAVKRDLGLR